MTDRVKMIRERLTEAFTPLQLEVADESHKHVGHAGARGGGGHFSVYLISPAFTGKTLIQRHRMVYEALGDAMNQDIHAVSIKALAPDEEPT
jgi:BolA protein